MAMPYAFGAGAMTGGGRVGEPGLEAPMIPMGSQAAAMRVTGLAGGTGAPDESVAMQGLLEEEGLSGGMPDLGAMTGMSGPAPFAPPGALGTATGGIGGFINQIMALEMQLIQAMNGGNMGAAQQILGRIEGLANRLNGAYAANGLQMDYPPGFNPAAFGLSGGEWLPASDFGGSSGTAGGSFGAPGASAVDASPTDFNGQGTPIGEELAQIAHQHATDGTGDGEHCFRNVGADLRKIGIQTSGGAAYMAADELAANPRVQELKGVSPDQLKHLPPGAIVVWNRGAGHPYGHISIAMGNGTEASDVMRNQVTHLGTSYRVFIVKG